MAVIIPESADTTWSDVLGNEVDATTVYLNACRDAKVGLYGLSIDVLAAWIEARSRELHGDDHRPQVWHALAIQLMKDAGYW